MIVIEGSDGSGKTTLAHSLARDFNLRVADTGPRDTMNERTREYSFNALAEAVRGHGPLKIYDRFGFISEVVYGPIWRDKVEFNVWEVEFAHRVMRAVGMPIIYCRPPDAQITDNVYQTKQLGEVSSTIPRIISKYDEVFEELNRARLNTVTYDYTANAKSDVPRVVEEYMTLRRARTW